MTANGRAPVFDYRALDEADIPAIVALSDAASRAAGREPAATPEHFGQIFAMLGGQASTNSRAAMAPGGELAGLALVLTSEAEEEHLAMCDVQVHPAYADSDLRLRFLAWVEARARESFAGVADQLPQVLRISRPEHMRAEIALLEQLGFRPWRYAYELRRPLNSRLPARSLPAPLTMAPWTPASEAALIAAFNIAFAEQPGLPQMTPEIWRAHFTLVPPFRRDLSFLALDGAEIAGFCVNWVVQERRGEAQSEEGWIEALGVLPAWRGRGVAKALMTCTLNAFVEEGFQHAGLDVDAQNPTGALRLYTGLGFTKAKANVSLVKLLT